MEYYLPNSVFIVLIIVVALIILDALFGVIRAIKAGDFDWSKFPKFLATNVFPYCGGILLLALAATYIGGPFQDYIYYAVAAPVAAKFVKELWTKINDVLGVDIDVDIEIKPPAS